MTRVTLQTPLHEGTTLLIDRDVNSLVWHIGSWTIEVFDSKLTVRPRGAAINAGRDVLKVDVGDA